MIQNIYPHKLYNEYRPNAAASESTPLLCYKGNCVLVNASEDAKDLQLFPTLSMLQGNNNTKAVYAFALDDTEFFIDISEETYELEGFEYADLHQLRSRTDHAMGLVIYTGHHLFQWYDVSRFCGKCSCKTAHSSTERAMKCSCCGKTIYPRIMPAVIVGVTNGDKLLVTKYNRGFAHFALVAGFVEIGETLEQAVEREVMEETGLKVKNIRYAGSQPWGVAQNLLSGYYCDVDGSTEVTLDETELKLAEWRKREEIILQPDDYSLTNDMMRRFKEGKD